MTIIRNANINDIPALIELRKQLLSLGNHHYAAKNVEEDLQWQKSYMEWLVKNLNVNPKINVIVSASKESDEITGCAIGIVDERVPYMGCLNGLMGWVQTVVVAPDFRRQGLAKRMMDYLCTWFVANGVNKVTLQTTSMAESLYKTLGFIDSGENLLFKALRD